MKNLLFPVLFITVLFSCNTKSDYESFFKDPDIYCKSVFELNTVVMGNNFTPVVASRNYMYANVAAYEIIAAGYPSQYNSLVGQVKELNYVPKPEAGKKINFEFAALLAFWKLGELVTFSPNETGNYVDSLKELAKAHGMPSAVYNNSVSYADTVASAIMEWSKHDNYAKTRGMSDYTVMPDSPARWIPTPPAYAAATEPHWREIRTLVLDSASEFKPIRPPKYDPFNKSSEFYKELMLVKKTVDSLTSEQKHIANFWDDNPFKMNVSGHLMFATKKFSPPGHWMGIVGIIAQKEKTDFATTVYAYTKTSIALFDGFISAWDEKFRSNLVRPETVINKYFDPNWQTYIQTPPFPEYVSAHSIISAAAAEVLTDIFGDNISYRDSSEREFGVPDLSFMSVREAAKQAAISRLYGGIHYKSSCTIGNVQGAKLGEMIVERLKMKK